MTSRVLIVDESPLLRAGLRTALEAEVTLAICGEAASGREALDLARATGPDLIVTDLCLPDAGGLDLIQRLRAHSATSSILVLCQHEERLFAERVFHAGAMGFVSKSAAITDVLAAVRQVLAGRVYFGRGTLEQLAAGRERQHLGSRGTMARLSEREFEVFELIGRGQPNREIARRLHLSVKTVESHREKIKRKLGIAGSVELARYAFQWSMEST